MARRCYYVDETMKSPNGYIPAIVVEGESGFTPCVGSGEQSQPWYWGHNFVDARRLAAEANKKLGLTPQDVTAILTSSIATQIREDAERERHRNRVERAFAGKPLDVRED